MDPTYALENATGDCGLRVFTESCLWPETEQHGSSEVLLFW